MTNGRCAWTFVYPGLFLKTFSVGGIWSELIGRVTEFNIPIISDPVQLYIKMSTDLKLVRLKIEFSYYLDCNCMRLESIKDFGCIKLPPSSQLLLYEIAPVHLQVSTVISSLCNC